MSNIIFLKDKPDSYTLDIKENDITVKTIYIFKSYNHLKNSILNNIENKIIASHNSKLKRESYYLLKKEINESLKKRMIHLPNLYLENNKNITVFEIFTKEQTLTLDNFNKDYIKELIDKYKLNWVKGDFEAYKTLNLYHFGLIFNLQEKTKSNDNNLNIKLIYSKDIKLLEDINLYSEGELLINYKLVDGSLKVNLTHNKINSKT